MSESRHAETVKGANRHRAALPSIVLKNKTQESVSLTREQSGEPDMGLGSRLQGFATFGCR